MYKRKYTLVYFQLYTIQNLTLHYYTVTNISCQHFPSPTNTYQCNNNTFLSSVNNSEVKSEARVFEQKFSSKAFNNSLRPFSIQDDTIFPIKTDRKVSTLFPGQLNDNAQREISEERAQLTRIKQQLALQEEALKMKEAHYQLLSLNQGAIGSSISIIENDWAIDDSPSKASVEQLVNSREGPWRGEYPDSLGNASSEFKPMVADAQNSTYCKTEHVPTIDPSSIKRTYGRKSFRGSIPMNRLSKSWNLVQQTSKEKPTTLINGDSSLTIIPISAMNVPLNETIICSTIERSQLPAVKFDSVKIEKPLFE